MLPKSRRALTIQEIAALARSSLHGNCLPVPGCGVPEGSPRERGSPMGEGSVPLGKGIGVTPLESGGLKVSLDPWWYPRGGHGGARSEGQ